MTICRQATSSILQFECPKCADILDDEFELFTPDQLHRLRCGACDGEYHAAVLECCHCGTETVFSWEEPPPAAQLADFFCPSCEQPGRDHEETSVPPFPRSASGFKDLA